MFLKVLPFDKTLLPSSSSPAQCNSINSVTCKKKGSENRKSHSIFMFHLCITPLGFVGSFSCDLPGKIKHPRCKKLCSPSHKNPRFNPEAREIYSEKVQIKIAVLVALQT